MSSPASTLPAQPVLQGPEVERVLGSLRGAQPGPTLVCIGGLHGNEPAGVRALQRVLARLVPRESAMRGDLVALAGNRPALAVGRRFLDRDLNRAWTDERLARLRQRGAAPELVEDREQIELLEAFEAAVAAARGPVYLLDLHTTSGPGGPFITFGDMLPHRELAAHIPVPMILGLEELLDGTLSTFLGRHGIVGLAFEAGQHEEPRAVDRAEAGILLTVVAVGLLPEALVPEVVAARKLLFGDTRHLPRAMELVYRHGIGPLDGFAMDPGYRSFQPVRKRQAVAKDVRGPVRVDRDARILMPLYQKLGDDGFFLIREFSPFWMQASYVLRKLRLDRIVHWLPGLSLDPALAGAVVVDRGVARWYATELLHLLGFRIHEDVGARLVMRRRRPDDARYVVEGPTSGALR